MADKFKLNTMRRAAQLLGAYLRDLSWEADARATRIVEEERMNRFMEQRGIPGKRNLAEEPSRHTREIEN